MHVSKDHYESSLREDLLRLAVTAAIVIGLLVIVTALQEKTGFMNVLLVAPASETTTEPGVAPAESDTAATPTGPVE